MPRNQRPPAPAAAVAEPRNCPEGNANPDPRHVARRRAGRRAAAGSLRPADPPRLCGQRVQPAPHARRHGQFPRHHARNSQPDIVAFSGKGPDRCKRQADSHPRFRRPASDLGFSGPLVIQAGLACPLLRFIVLHRPLPGDKSEMNREPTPLHPLLARLREARETTDALFAVVKPEFLYDRPISERHRIVFYIGHLEAFDRNLFDQRVCDLPAFNPELDQLFAFGIDPVDGGFPADQPADWPSLEIVRDYALTAREQIDRAFNGLSGHDVAQSEASRQLLNVAIEHRLMHAETLAYMLHQLPLAQKVTELREPVATRTEHRDSLSSMVGV